MPPQQVLAIGQRYDQDNSGSLEFDEFLQMMVEWTQIGGFQAQFAQFGQQRAGARELQQVFGGITIFYQTIGGAVPTIRPFSLNTCRTLIAMFGSALPGEGFASTVTYEEWLRIA